MTSGLTLLGATGSVGASTLDVAARNADRYRIFALTAHRAADALLALCRRHSPRYAVLSGLPEDQALRRSFTQLGGNAAGGTELLFGAAALEQVCADRECDVVVAAIVGAAGLAPILAGARAGKRLLLANKESLVMAGALFMRTVREHGATLLPIDSEHNAVFQCLPQASGRASTRAVRRILLTASGGPFRSAPLERLSQVTPEQACAHPNWVMGRKISVDSATMMNKGLEVIEAHWLFDVPPERIEVLVHSQSVVHSLVEFVDGSVIAQLSNPDMRVPIAHALAFPERIESGAAPLDLAAIGQLSFERPDAQRFPCLGLAYAALREGGTAPAVLNAANEIAVGAFLEGRLPYTAIPQVIERTLREAPSMQADSLATVLEADRGARRAALECAALLMGKAA
jgi:1-deoxy-D-xylulose-5-phosphate reductoisomerase